jgi:hypothetical protein
MQEVHHRGSDDVINEVKALIEAEAFRNKEWQDKHDLEANKFRSEILEKIKPYEELSTVAKWIWRIGAGLGAGVFAGIKGWLWLKDHLR